MKQLKNQSTYRPEGEERERQVMVMKHFDEAKSLRDTPYEEFNDRILEQAQADSFRAFMSYVPPRSSNPEESWRSNIVKPIARNKVTTMAAHVVQSTIFPKVVAQNDQDDEDVKSAMVMDDVMEYINETPSVDFESKFVVGVVQALIQPLSIMQLGYREIHRDIRGKDGKVKRVKDEGESGIFCENVPVDELYLGSFYVRDIKRQPRIMRRRLLDYSEAETIYGEMDNWQHVKAGTRTVFDEEADVFLHERIDDNVDSENKVEEVVYYSRSMDLEIPYVGGVDMVDGKANRMSTRGDNDIPAYPFVVGGYGFIDDGRFAYYKPLIDNLIPESAVINTMYNMIMDGTYLQLMPSIAVFGDEDVDSGIMIPGTTHVFDTDSKIEPLKVSHDIRAGHEAIQSMERSIDQSSVGSIASGDSPQGRQSAREIATLQDNIDVVFGLFGRMLGFMIRDYGDLMMKLIVQHVPAADVGQMTTSAGKIAFQNIILSKKQGRSKQKTIQFTRDTPEEAAPKSEFDSIEEDIFNAEGGFDQTKEIIRVNPKLWKKNKFMMKIVPEQLFRKTGAVQKALNLEAYDRAVASPIADQVAVFKDLLIANYKPGDEDKYIKDEFKGKALEEMASMGEGGHDPRSKTSALVGEMTGSGGNNVGGKRIGLKELQNQQR